jgi:hypothetical protein
MRGCEDAWRGAWSAVSRLLSLVSTTQPTLPAVCRLPSAVCRLLSAVCCLLSPSRRRHVDAPGVDELSAKPGAGDHQRDP